MFHFCSALKSSALLTLGMLCALAGTAQNEVSVDQFTGTASVSIPLTAATMQGSAIPIGLAYTASGVRADDQGGLVGVGWALSGIPYLSREVRGLPDDALSEGTDARYGWLRAQTQAKLTGISSFAGFPPSYGDVATPQEAAAAALSKSFEARTSAGQLTAMYDSEPDIFSYSVPGHTGKFVFDRLGNVRTIPYDPIKITKGGYTTATAPDSLGYSIGAFVLQTPEGVTYMFNLPDMVQRRTLTYPEVDEKDPPIYFSRDYYYYKRQGGLKYPVTWHIAKAVNQLGEEITFGYDSNTYGRYSASLQQSSLLLNRSNQGRETQYQWLSRGSKSFLTRITTPTANILFSVQSSGDLYTNYLTGMEVTSSLMTGSGTSRSIRFQYYTSRAQNREIMAGPGAVWVNHYTHMEQAIRNEWTNGFEGPVRLFLQSVTTSTACTLPLSYKFKYHQIVPSTLTSVVPPPGTALRDLWGGIAYKPVVEQQGWPATLYAYPTLLDAQTPGWPFRLYPLGNQPAPSTANTTPSGDDYLPATEALSTTPNESYFQQSTLLGTLTQVTLPTGGRIQLAYEAHRFKDMKAQRETYTDASNVAVPYYGPGTRIRMVTWTDPVSAVTQKREYIYTDASLVTTGRMLRWPSFGFLDPLASSTATALQAAVQSSENLSPDPFENRVIGYASVTERIIGQNGVSRGHTTTTFSIPGTADDIAAILPDGPSWSRTVVGLGRTNNTNGIAPGFNPTGPYKPGYDGYPFPLNPNLDHWRGLPLRVEMFTPTVSVKVPAKLVKRVDYQYKLWKKETTSITPTVQGWSYEWAKSDESALLIPCARYDLLTDFRVDLVQETQATPDQVTASKTHLTNAYYRYNEDGYLACQAQVASDGSVQRTRYKYLQDYALPAVSLPLPTAPSQLQLLAYRASIENLTREPIETITEVLPAKKTMLADLKVAGATLNVFSLEQNTGVNVPGVHTRVKKVLHWQQTTLVPKSGPGSYDSTRVDGVGTSAVWYVAPLFASSPFETVLEEVDPRRLTPLSTSSRVGRTIQSSHMGYDGYFPVLQIANAYASEVRFSNFESSSAADQRYAWPTTLPVAASARRTGNYGLVLTDATPLQTSLPEPATATLPSPSATGYRLVAWIHGPQNRVLQVQLTNGATTVDEKVFSINKQNTWQRVEFLIKPDLLPLGPSSYKLSLSAKPGTGNIDVDDVLLLPVTATTRSTTYDPAQGLTSETDEQGRTTFYEYNGAGQIKAVRDQEQNILRQSTQIIAGQSRDITPTVSFSVGGTLREGQLVKFTAPTMLCGARITGYEWNFGAGLTNTATGTPTCIYPVTRKPGYDTWGTKYAVTLKITTANGDQYSGTQTIDLGAAIPPLFTGQPLRDGFLDFSSCGYATGESFNETSAGVSTAAPTVFTVQVPPSTGPCATYTYHWSVSTKQANGWSAPVQITSNSTNPLVLPPPGPVSATVTKRYTCTVTDACGQRIEVGKDTFITTVTYEQYCP